MISQLKHPIKYGLAFIAIGCFFPLVASLYGMTDYQIVDQIAGVAFLAFYFVSFILWVVGAFFILIGIFAYLRAREPRDTL